MRPFLLKAHEFCHGKNQLFTCRFDHHMKSLLKYFKDYWNEQQPLHLIFIGIFLSICIFFNYKYDIENTVIDSHYQTFKHFYLYLLLYGVGFIIPYLSYAYDREGRQMLSQPKFWGRVLFALLSFSAYCYFFQYKYWIESLFEDYNTQRIFKICADQLFQPLLLFLLVFVFWWYRDRKEQVLYGLKFHNEHNKIYAMMLLAMVPLVIGASFTEGFRDYYPTVRRILAYCTEEMPKGWYVALYEFCYGQEFFHIEFFFRGFLILAFVKYAGSRAILPAAIFYCFIHFGKPAGECVSSFFGGIILGVLSFRSQSIAAGIWIHLGIALLMELVASFWL